MIPYKMKRASKGRKETKSDLKLRPKRDLRETLKVA